MEKFLTYSFLIRIGLALVFLANSLTAFFAPSEFVEIIEKSFLANLLPISAGVFVTFIGINDAVVAFLLFTGTSKFRTAVWAGLWLISVIIVRGAPLDILEELGFLFMAIALAANNSKSIGKH